MADEQRAEPLTDSELAYIQDEWARTRETTSTRSVIRTNAVKWMVPRLLLEVARQRAELEAVRPVVVALVALDPDGSEVGAYLCPFGCGLTDTGTGQEPYAHAADCPVTQARELKARLGW